MNDFRESEDPMGLKKLDNTLKNLGSNWNKPKPYNTKDWKKNQERILSQKNNRPQQPDNLKILYEEGKKTIEALHKLATKNKIPKDYEGIMEMRNKLKTEEKQHEEIVEATKEIKQIQNAKKQRAIQSRKEKIEKFTRLFKK